ncbi:unnamed protein product [Lactuca saligna]|uniref:Uncharacterized protein n=1 Tax=Lactuca saligna TaxID=75948 RepID=A0AA35ZMR8_LACSI|nr:unnamed protein product [Lactuca saligna]
MANFNMNMMTSYCHLLSSSTKIPMLIHEFYDQWSDRIEDYLNGIDEDLWKCITGEIHPASLLQRVGTIASSSGVAQQTEKQKKNDKRCLRELHGALLPVVYNYVKKCMDELGDFKQKEGENIELYFDRINELIFKCIQYGVICSTMEFNLTFLMGLRKGWRNISLMIKTQQSFDYYSLGDLYNMLTAH